MNQAIKRNISIFPYHFWKIAHLSWKVSRSDIFQTLLGKGQALWVPEHRGGSDQVSQGDLFLLEWFLRGVLPHHLQIQQNGSRNGQPFILS